MANKIEITIDVIVHATEDIQKLFQAFEEKFGLKESDLNGHLENSNEGKADTSNADSTDLAARDYQLYEALNLLKAIVIVQK